MEESLKKSTSERLNELLPQLSKDQLRFVVACQEYPSKKEAAESIDIKPNTAYSWNGNVDEAIQLMKLEAVEAARAMNRQAVPKAMAVKIAALDSDNEAIRQKAATELIEWMTGKAPEKVEHTGKDGDEITIKIVSSQDGE
jgi:hypothetical protein